MARTPAAKSNTSAPAKAPRARATGPGPGLEALQALHLALGQFDLAATRELGLNRSDAACLRLLSSGSRRASEIGQALGLTSGSVTALVDRLEANKLVKRTPSEEDRRVVLVGLTAATARRLHKAYQPLETALEAALGVKKRASLEALLAVARTLTV